MIKNVLTSTVLLGCVASASASDACVVPAFATEEVRGAVHEKGGWPLTRKQCELLRELKVEIHVDGLNTVLAGVSIGWATVRIADASKNYVGVKLVSNVSAGATYVNPGVASMDTAKELLYSAVKHAVKNLDYEKAIQQVIAAREKEK